MDYKTYHFKKLASTQDKAKELSKKGLSNIVVISDTQTKGRGRFKRKWHSSKDGLYFSVLLKPDNAKNLQYLTLAAAIAVQRSIKRLIGINTKIKWPNDVHYDGKKLCGILTEGIFGAQDYAIIGFGINANQDSFPDDIKDIATSLKLITKKQINKEKLAKSTIEEFLNLYNNCYSKNKLNQIIRMWKEHCDTLGKNVAVHSKNRKISGIAVGIGKDCSLLVKSRNKTVKILEGDIKVRY